MKFEELDLKLSQLELPQEIVIGPHCKIHDVPKMVQSHLQIIRSQRGKRVYKPYYDRLKLIYDFITSNK